MRVAIAIHGDNIDDILETYELMSQNYFTHATPTLYNAGTHRQQLSSCFLMDIKSDSIDGIYDTLKNCALISKYAGGIGIAIHKVRASNSFIRGTNGYSNGLVPMLKVYNETARYVDQGGNKRKGSFAVYLEPWHADINSFLELKKNTGAETERARDLFYALWIPDLFMKRVEADDKWSLFCPDECKGLDELYGDEFEKLYLMYEREKKYRKQVRAQDIWKKILESQIETGGPYIAFKDSMNRKSNQKNRGTIKTSNLCIEICEYTSQDEVAVCNLASISLPTFLKDDKTIDFNKLINVTGVITKNLNKIIDINYYPIPETKTSNLRNRPIGIGVQGLANLLAIMKIPYESEEAKLINKQIFETIYYGAITTSIKLAISQGPYETFEGSPTSEGLLQFDLWNVVPNNGLNYDWAKVKEDLVKHGIRNSLLTAAMPTASTSQILGNMESFEPFTSNIYTKGILAGDYTMVNSNLINDLIELKLWNEEMRQTIQYYNGSIQKIPQIPDDIKKLYKTVWEIKQKHIVDMAIDRGPYIDQSQSMNIYIASPNFKKLHSSHFYGWKNGLKTGIYYLRSKPASDAIKFTIDPILIKKLESGSESDSEINSEINSETSPKEIKVCKYNPNRNPECDMCSG